MNLQKLVYRKKIPELNHSHSAIGYSQVFGGVGETAESVSAKGFRISLNL